jgi:putative membrane protein
MSIYCYNVSMKQFPLYLLILYIVVFVWGGIHPYARDVWFVENATVWVVLIAILILYVCKIRFSNMAYFLMAIFIIMHTIGGHYTFERVPFDYITNLFGFERNNYDRFAHFTVGFYAFPIVEYMITRGVIAKKWVAYLFGLFTIMAVAAAYELFEWVYAILSDPTAGIAVLGSQGDIWDAQKDMINDTLGGITGVIMYMIAGKKNN